MRRRACSRRCGSPLDQADDGALLLRSADELGDYPVTVLHSLRAVGGGRTRITRWSPSAARTAAWRTVSYGAAVAAADAIGQALLELGLGPARPLLLLSGNGVNHLLMTLGALTAGIPVAPVSVAYSLQSTDHARIKAIAELITPGAVYAEDAAAFGAALDARGRRALPVVGRGIQAGRDTARRTARHGARPGGARRVRRPSPPT